MVLPQPWFRLSVQFAEIFIRIQRFIAEDNYSLVVQGLARFRVVELVQEHPYLKARIEPVDDKTSADEVEIEALGINLKKLAREVI